jgi:hypothetical protein
MAAKVSRLSVLRMCFELDRSELMNGRLISVSE